MSSQDCDQGIPKGVPPKDTNLSNIASSSHPTTKPPRPPKPQSLLAQPQRKSASIMEVKDSYLKLHVNRQHLVSERNGNLYSLPATGSAVHENTYVNTEELFGDQLAHHDHPSIVSANRTMVDSGLYSATSFDTPNSTSFDQWRPPEARLSLTSPSMIECIDSAKLDALSQPYMSASAMVSSPSLSQNGRRSPKLRPSYMDSPSPQRTNVSVRSELIGVMVNVQPEMVCCAPNRTYNITPHFNRY